MNNESSKVLLDLKYGNVIMNDESSKVQLYFVWQKKVFFFKTYFLVLSIGCAFTFF